MRLLAYAIWCLALAAQLPAFAEVFIVDSTVDAVDAVPGDGTCASASNGCTLRAAIEEANAFAGPDAVEVPAGTFLLSLGELRVTDDLELAGSGWPDTTISAGGSSRVVWAEASLVLSLVKIADGVGQGGGIASQVGNLIIRECAIVDNDGGQGLGGGIFVATNGTLEVFDSWIANNKGGFGGGIFSFGSTVIRIVGSTLFGNTATHLFFSAQGGGIWGGDMELVNSTISSNSAEGPGGGIWANKVELVNSTVSDNSAGRGGGIWADEVELVNSTVSNNSVAGNGGAIQASRVRIENSTISANTNPAIDSLGDLRIYPRNSIIDGACGVTFLTVDRGLNIETGDTCDLTPFSLVNTDPMVGPLQDNGGPTWTHDLLPGSPAVDAIPLEDCVWDDDGILYTPEVPLPYDQRGVERPQGANCDIGAVEYAPEPAQVLMLAVMSLALVARLGEARRRKSRQC